MFAQRNTHHPRTLDVATACVVPALLVFLTAGPAWAASPNAHASTPLPSALRPVLYRTLTKYAGPMYAVHNNGCASLSRQSLTACFTAGGVHFRGAYAPALTLQLTAFGRGDKLTAVHAVKPLVKGNRVRYAHCDVSEWWRVLSVGFEQGFTFAQRPSGHGELVLALAANHKPSQQNAGVSSIRHSRGSGNPVKNVLDWGRLRYGQLVVTDATGKLVPATLKSEGKRILISVNDAHAAYPLTVDPLVWLEQKVTASDGAASDRLGISVALDGTTALVATPFATVNGNSVQGAAYVFSESNGIWSQIAKLTANDGEAGDNFGKSVALSGATALVGAQHATAGGSSSPGAAYVFSGSSGAWTQTAKLTASDGADGDGLGYSVALDGTTALISAPFAKIASKQFQGAVYVFTESGGGWSQTAKLSASDGAASNFFGISAALAGTTALVGAPGAAVNGNVSQGATYVFGEAGGAWTQTQKLTASDGGANDGFGASVALDGPTALVGAPGAAVNGNAGQGAAYVFGESGGAWTQTQKLTVSDGATSDDFGTSVALAGMTALVGTQHSTAISTSPPGVAYVFAESGGTWKQTVKLTASDGADGDGFGRSVALAGTTALIGAPFAAIAGNQWQGAAYLESESNLGLAVSAPQSVNQGQQYASQVIATNNSATTSAPMAVTVYVPPAASYISTTTTQGNCSEASGVVTCDFGQISGNVGTASANVMLKATGKVGGTIENTASVAKVTPPLTASATTTIGASSNHPPVASNGTLTADENTAADGALVATDVDGDTLTFSIVVQPAHGSVKITDVTKGTYIYTPAKDFSGSDGFTFKANNGQAGSNIATISVTVKASPPPPSAPPSPPSSSGGGGGGFSWLSLAVLLGLALTAMRSKRRQS